MKTGWAATHWMAALLLWAAATPMAFAQTLYRCNSGSGTQLSDRPCQSTGGSTEIRSIGPAPDRNVYNRDYTPALQKAPDILPFLSPECAQMNDAVRTGPTRGLKGAAMSELVTNYRLRCGEDEQQAHQKMSQARSDERNQRQLAQAAQTAEVARTKLGVEQCDEMLRILSRKRQRTATMTPGEQRDLEIFEANHRARCKPG